MKIFGIGIDLLDSSRIYKLYEKYEHKLKERILSENEILVLDKIKNKDRKINYIAKRFSAKESFLKALGIGLGHGIKFDNIEIVNDELGKPHLNLDNKATKIVENLYKIAIIYIKFDLSITDERNFINTITIISGNNYE